jgi:hypothetical protein
MIQTAIGLPNTCSRCGRRCTGEWWAEHEDAARAGAGLCDGCASVPPVLPEVVCAQPAAPVRYDPVGETLTRVQPSRVKRSKGK